MKENRDFRSMSSPYRITSGRMTFLVSSFSDQNAVQTSEEIILEILEKQVEENLKQQQTEDVG